MHSQTQKGGCKLYAEVSEANEQQRKCECKCTHTHTQTCTLEKSSHPKSSNLAMRESQIQSSPMFLIWKGKEPCRMPLLSSLHDKPLDWEWVEAQTPHFMNLLVTGWCSSLSVQLLSSSSGNSGTGCSLSVSLTETKLVMTRC